jgi:carotenoid cleavage dioxygenase
MPSPIETAIRKTVTLGVLKLADFNRGRMAEPDQPNPFLSGLNAPMDRELTLDQLQVTGTIPPSLDGRYLRIGPNPINAPKAASHHWFVGDGMVHGLRLKDGQALWYRNRWIRSTAVSKALGEDRAPGPRHISDTVNTNVVGHAGKTWALVEAGGYPVELGDELQTLAHNPFEGSLKGSFSAHGHLDTTTGALHAICYEATDQQTIRHVVVGADGCVQREEPIAVKHGPSVHDCMVTAQYVVVLDLPVTFSMATLVAGYSFPYIWNPAHKARVGLLKKDAPGSEIVWCAIDPCYVFHPCNGFENADGTVTLDVVAHATMFEHSRIGPGAKGSAFERWTIDPVARQVARRVIDDQPQEFPRPDERRLGQPYRHAYTAGLQRDGEGEFVGDQVLIHHDLQAGTRELHDFGPGRHVGEFVFEPRHAGADEGDGWLMGFVVDARRQTTDFVILDALNFSGPPQAVVTIPHRIPAGFHGNWVPTQREGRRRGVDCSRDRVSPGFATR